MSREDARRGIEGDGNKKKTRRRRACFPKENTPPKDLLQYCIRYTDTTARPNGSGGVDEREDYRFLVRYRPPFPPNVPLASTDKSLRQQAHERGRNKATYNTFNALC